MPEITEEELKNLHSVLGKLENTLTSIDELNGIINRNKELAERVERLYQSADVEKNKSMIKSFTSIAEQMAVFYSNIVGREGELRRLESVLLEIRQLASDGE